MDIDSSIVDEIYEKIFCNIKNGNLGYKKWNTTANLKNIR